MPLTETITAEIKEAMKAGDKLRLETLRSLRAAILDFEKSGLDRPMEEADEFKIVNAAAKRRRDAVEQYEAAGRKDLADKERQELAIIETFLPAMMSDDDIRTELRTIITAIGATTAADVGKVMKAAMVPLKGKADGAAVQRLARELLS